MRIDGIDASGELDYVDDLTIRVAFASDAPSIAALMRRTHTLLPNPDLYVIADEAHVAWMLEMNSFGYIVERDGEPGAFSLFMRPGHDRSENLGYEAGLSDAELDRVLCVDSVCVLPVLRGRGLQRELIRMGEREGIRRGADIFMATVDPRNEPSLRNFTASGYRVVKRVGRMYAAGVPRLILMKQHL